MKTIMLRPREGRNHAIDLMKCLAAIAITNSHMVNLYPGKYSILAMGGAIGDSLFFFCSGFCLMLGCNLDFFNWYKRRVNRIFPTIFAVSLIGIIFLGNDPTLKHIIIRGGGWFVQAIFVFYAVFWFVKRFLSDKIWVSFAINTIIIIVWFIFFWNKDVFILYNGTYLRWPGYFMMMLMGAAISNKIKTQSGGHKLHSGWIYVCMLIVLLIFYYGYQLMWNSFPILKEFQIVLLPILMGIIYVIYKICSDHKVLRVYQYKYLYWIMYSISACCLEIYLSGGMSFWIGRELIAIFPLNIILSFISIFIIAYFVKIFSNFLSQTFKSERYDWKRMVTL